MNDKNTRMLLDALGMIAEAHSSMGDMVRNRRELIKKHRRSEISTLRLEVTLMNLDLLNTKVGQVLANLINISETIENIDISETISIEGDVAYVELKGDERITKECYCRFPGNSLLYQADQGAIDIGATPETIHGENYIDAMWFKPVKEGRKNENSDETTPPGNVFLPLL